MAEMMAAINPYVGLAAMGLTLLGAGEQAQGYDAYGAAAQQSAEFEAAQLEQAAGETRAASQRDIEETNRKRNIALSKAQAVAAASGAGALDPSVLNLMAGITGEAEYAKNTALYEAESKAGDFETKAKVARYGGYQTAKSMQTQAKNTIIGGVADATMGMAKFWAGGSTPSAATGTKLSSGLPASQYGYSTSNDPNWMYK